MPSASAKDLPVARPLLTVTPPPPPPLPFHPSGGGGGRAKAAGLCSSVLQQLDRAVQSGYLLEAEKKQLEEQLLILEEQPPAVQIAAVSKFVSLRFSDFRWISKKAIWLQRCMKFCIRTSSSSLPSSDSSATSKLVAALASHALLPDSLAQECWDTFIQLPAQLQDNVVRAVKHSLIMSIGEKPSEHFAHLCVNEEVTYNLDAKTKPQAHPTEQLEWEAIDETLYHRLLQQMMFKRRNAEERLLQMLAEDGTGQPGMPGSLLYVHMATSAARQNGSAEFLSLLHAAAACGLDRLCTRFLAEGLQVNEQAGVQETTALHLAAANGAVNVVELLLRNGANPTIKDSEEHTAIYSAMTATALEFENGETDPDAPIHSKLQFQVCELLLTGILFVEGRGFTMEEEEDIDIEAIALERKLPALRNLIRLHRRLRELRRRMPQLMTETLVKEICGLQYETACFVLALFEGHVNVQDEAAYVEYRAILNSEFIQARNQVQRFANRLAKRLELSRKSIDLLMTFPPQAALFALESWRLEEMVEGIYEIPRGEEANPEPKPLPPPVQPKDYDKVEDEDSRVMGQVRKWDAERGYGFIVQDNRGGDESLKDIFVHRTNLKGISQNPHIDLNEGSRISYTLGMQDGKPRAMQAAMIDDDGKILDVHVTPAPEKDVPKEKKKGFVATIIDEEQDEMSKKFMMYLQSPPVQEVAKEKRPECEAWLRCVGLRRHNTGRRDDNIWKKEIERRIDYFLDQKSTPLQKRDFDFRVRRFLNEFCMHSTVARVSEALAMVNKYTTGKNRDDVRSWPAYLATLLRKFDPDVYASLTTRDRMQRSANRERKKDDDDAADLPASGPAKELNGENVSEGEDDSEQSSSPPTPRRSGGDEVKAAGSSFAFQ